ncbi:MAG: hypothetical protein CVU86_07110 [Firmicutes bacterium HGW-Firmicutes-11]|jgi:nucleoside 2-deoxyribosyltransferase|nr:MAG: hypothetical protein CVU94_00695 [Firmicutes bacterium HGW-Firmicutes-19]PKM84494.1 MAG: hypothetical protein CVU86_07110 [Firmicutes bacterium HGW-Firmicutes-11]
MNKSIFLICPVRNATEVQKQKMEKHISKIESQGHTIYYPARDTDQNDGVGYRICTDNLNAMKAADEIHIFWDPSSTGTLFDLGMAFALKKKLKIVNFEEVEITRSKSFSNMIRHWQNVSVLGDLISAIANSPADDM